MSLPFNAINLAELMVCLYELRLPDKIAGAAARKKFQCFYFFKKFCSVRIKCLQDFQLILKILDRKINNPEISNLTVIYIVCFYFWNYNIYAKHSGQGFIVPLSVPPCPKSHCDDVINTTD